MKVLIRKAIRSDMEKVEDLIVSAFGEIEGSQIVVLVSNLLADKSAYPLFSLVATVEESIVGYILFTSTIIEYSDHTNCSAILAPLAVLPEFQSQGIGAQLVTRGLNQLMAVGIDIVFVLGYPEYYTKYGFSPAGRLGYEAPYPIADKDADAWMVRSCFPDQVERVNRKVVCADSLNNPGYWRE